MLMLDNLTDRKSFIHSLDPRLKIFIYVTLSIYFSISTNFIFLITGLFLSIFLIKIARINFEEIAGRLFFINLFMLTLFATVPFSFDNDYKDYCFKIFSLGYRYDMLVFTSKIFLRSNILLLLLTSLLSTINFVILGHALNHIFIPKKLIHLFLFSIRYLTIIHQEYINLKRSAIIRGFKPKMNIHTYKTFANFAGMLLVRSLNRSEKIINAMKCRCFNGNFYLIYHFHVNTRDWITGGIYILFLTFLLYGDFYV